MTVEAARHISLTLIAGLTLSCLFFLGSASCRAFLAEAHTGHFCSAEQANAPAPVTDAGASHMTAPHSKNPLLRAVVTPAVLTTLLVIVWRDDRTKRFARRMEETLVRHGPYQRMFLPYLMATHDR
ncbi:hypothetical protein FJZ23_00805 [Candidatus Parcubacteria bacterium]|nr:hypothetical protein [Candidatus Parcubacteria bacterium]